jgi:hypothetical protein
MTPATAPTTPAVSAPVLVQVVTRAGRRCECTGRGCHGRTERCERALPAVRLLAAPRDVSVPVHAAWRIPTEELAAWCGRCFDHAQAQARRARTARLAGQAAAGVLPLDLDVAAGQVGTAVA